MRLFTKLLKKHRSTARKYADPIILGKAEETIERYREIISDPLNLLISRVPSSGYVDSEKCVILHNGNRVPVEGDLAYYREFSDILILNRGVHEPLEEFCFQETLKKIRSPSPLMLELGAYWAHYSMWFLKEKPDGVCVMVEPDQTNLNCGRNNFSINKFKGEFIKSFVGRESFKVDEFVSERKIERLQILHSDIQGYELEMLEGSSTFLQEHRADYIFVSTHSQKLHSSVVQTLENLGYRVEISADFDHQTTSLDGFVLASSPNVEPIFEEFVPMGRIEIAGLNQQQLIAYLLSVPLVRKTEVCEPL